MTTKYIWYSEWQSYGFADMWDCSHCGATIVFEHENVDGPLLFHFNGMDLAPDIYVFCDTDCGEFYENRVVADYVSFAWGSNSDLDR